MRLHLAHVACFDRFSVDIFGNNTLSRHQTFLRHGDGLQVWFRYSEDTGTATWSVAKAGEQ
ncbi:hypothetical protein H7849_17985 [Alloacidobacterium dinghuense]|uniref:Uncharacterized protein n=1 Tax=Alloacidobacterium dinghuense TaxID=2763107 RepID=A0A7G8BEL7_9BACT|nr:hypothetical protein [Alloacidobacterium dinghuense]QNI30987.1 hypothetical protein H7849_17985 [Alloacidobacterium dinghuense]